MASAQAALQLYNKMPLALKNTAQMADMATASVVRLVKVCSSMAKAAQFQAVRLDINGVNIELVQAARAVAQVKEQGDQLEAGIKKSTKASGEFKKSWVNVSKGLGAVGIEVGAKEILKNANDYLMAGNTLQAQTGLSGGDLGMAKESIKSLYVDNMGDSMDGVAKSLSTVYQVTGRTGAGLEQMTRAGILLSDTFGYDVTSSIRAAEALEKQFGASGAEAFDLIIQGTQAGLDTNGDLLDTVQQYSKSFSKLGLGGADMMNMLVNGSESGTVSIGALGAAVDEFTKRVTDGSGSTHQTFEALGLDAGGMAKAFGSGGDTANQAFQQTMNAIGSLEDPVQRNIAGASLFGSAWETLGYQGVMALSNLNGPVESTTENLKELNGVKYDDATSALGALSRTVNMGLGSVVGGMVSTITSHISDFTTGLQGDVGQIQGIFGGIGFVAGWIGNLISSNWSVIEPILWGVVAALVVYNATMGSAWLTTMKSTVSAAWQGMTGWIASIRSAIAAQGGLNAIMAANPLTWILIIIIAVIAAVFAIVAVINKVMGTSISATGVIIGAVAAVGAFLMNTFIGTVNAIIQFAWSMFVEPFIGIIEWVLNVVNGGFDSFGGAISNLIGQIISWFLSLGKVVTKIIDAVFGTSWTDGLSSLQDEVTSWGKNEDAVTIELEAPELGGRIAYDDAYNAGYGLGEGIEDNVKGMFDTAGDPFGGIEDPYAKDPYEDLLGSSYGADGGSIPNTLEGIYNNTGDTAGNTAAMSDTEDMLEEDLKYMRDAAEQEIINRFTLAELKVDVNNNNTLKTQTDFDAVNRQLAAATGEILTTAAEGGYI